MKVSACNFYSTSIVSSPYFKGITEEGKSRPCQVSKHISNTGNDVFEKKNIERNCAIAGGGILAAGIAAFQIYKRNSLPYLLKKLNGDKLFDSFPQTLQNELAKGKRFEKLKTFLTAPDKIFISGTGANSTVYNLPFTDNYVLKIVKDNAPLDLSKQYIGRFPDTINLGQPVWQHPDNPRILLLKKIKGEPHSIKDWSKTMYNPQTGQAMNVTSEQAQNYFTQISRIAEMNQSVFDDLATQIKVLDGIKKFDNDNLPGFKIDSINPNNLMVDYKNNKMNIIDYFAKENEHHNTNSYLDMVAVISDFPLLPEYKALLKQEEQSKLIEALKIINDKCFNAAAKAGLSTDKNVFMDYINEVHRYFKPLSVKKQDGSGEYLRFYDQKAQELLETLGV